MTDTRHFIILGDPQGKERPRFSLDGHTYTPGKTRNYEKAVRYYYAAMCHQDPFPPGTALCVTIKAIFAVAKSDSIKKRQAKLCGVIFPTKKSDADNIAKVICDSLNGIAYHDDSQITTLHVTKRYGTEPRVEVWISREDT